MTFACVNCQYFCNKRFCIVRGCHIVKHCSNLFHYCPEHNVNNSRPQFVNGSGMYSDNQLDVKLLFEFQYWAQGDASGCTISHVNDGLTNTTVPSSCVLIYSGRCKRERTINMLTRIPEKPVHHCKEVLYAGLLVGHGLAACLGYRYVHPRDKTGYLLRKNLIQV